MADSKGKEGDLTDAQLVNRAWRTLAGLKEVSVGEEPPSQLASQQTEKERNAPSISKEQPSSPTVSRPAKSASKRSRTSVAPTRFYRVPNGNGIQAASRLSKIEDIEKEIHVLPASDQSSSKPVSVSGGGVIEKSKKDEALDEKPELIRASSSNLSQASSGSITVTREVQITSDPIPTTFDDDRKVGTLELGNEGATTTSITTRFTGVEAVLEESGGFVTRTTKDGGIEHVLKPIPKPTFMEGLKAKYANSVDFLLRNTTRRAAALAKNQVAPVTATSPMSETKGAQSPQAVVPVFEPSPQGESFTIALTMRLAQAVRENMPSKAVKRCINLEGSHIVHDAGIDRWKDFNGKPILKDANGSVWFMLDTAGQRTTDVIKVPKEALPDNKELNKSTLYRVRYDPKKANKAQIEELKKCALKSLANTVGKKVGRS